ncbi:DUF3124 domain-containing protein [Persicitalea jodogahamensis]|uniref:DUF3124 domain-containing protein n=1 Tax=Persicitalea jodogahamensis TaxID=402147 RepID=A0A8J3G8B9_9BACT|nr:DUF3124 domain-containing protein [Persicitalea jodogahamensis]GHB63835.1 hypothetical protein GCM10007390_17080 [Persicitalea jodogahamensis]
MKKIKLTWFILSVLAISCEQEEQSTVSKQRDIHQEDWSKRAANISETDSLIFGKTYLSVYSEMYSFSQKQKYSLTGMISLRNVSETDTIYLLRADYYDTAGSRIRGYFKSPVYLRPMETVEIVIAHKDIEGGTGSNFLFEWKTPPNCPEPLFEGVMNSMQGSKGVAFVTQGKRTK